MTMQSSRPLPRYSYEAYPREAAALVALVREGELVLDAPYQRGSVWSLDQRRNLVRSFLMGLPIPTLVLNDRVQESWTADGTPAAYAVIDGKQRVESAVAWFSGELDVPASWFDPAWVAAAHETDDGLYVTLGELSDEGQRFAKRQAKLSWSVARVPTLADEAQIFGLVNGSGVAQDEQTMLEAARIAAGGQG